MATSDMSKQQQFLWAAQTLMVTDAVRLADRARINGDIARIPSTMMIMGVALHASERIPDDMRVIDAVEAFRNHMLPDQEHDRTSCPDWYKT